MYKCFEEGKLAGAILTLNCAKTGKPNLSEAEKTTRSLSGSLPVVEPRCPVIPVRNYPRSPRLLQITTSGEQPRPLHSQQVRVQGVFSSSQGTSCWASAFLL